MGGYMRWEATDPADSIEAKDIRLTRQSGGGWLVHTVDSGKDSYAFTTKGEVIDWLDDHMVEDEG